jgi:hypothetical protein
MTVCAAWSAAAQGMFRQDQYKALTGVKEIRFLVTAAENEKDKAVYDSLGLEPKTINDIATVKLANSVPRIRLGNKSDVPQLLLWWFGNERALSLSIGVWQWVHIPNNNQDVYAEVWRRELVISNANRAAVKDAIDNMLTGFAADYIRANRQ